MTVYELWMQGYLVTGMEGIPQTAVFLGRYEADTFIEACRKYQVEKHDSYYRDDGENASSWGCRIFDNEHDARKIFG